MNDHYLMITGRQEGTEGRQTWGKYIHTQRVKIGRVSRSLLDTVLILVDLLVLQTCFPLGANCASSAR